MTRTVTVNGVILPLDLPAKGGTKDGYQIFLQGDTRHMEKHLSALAELPKLMYPGWSRVLHPFGGVGVSAQQIAGRFPGCRQELWERDEVCYEYLKEHWEHVRLVEDSYKELTKEVLYAHDVIVMDPTAGTIKGMVDFWDLAAHCGVPLVWVTDSACSKIWLHKEHYVKEFGREVEDADDYMRAYDTFLRKRGYAILKAMREQAASYFIVCRDTTLPPLQNIERL